MNKRSRIIEAAVFSWMLFALGMVIGNVIKASSPIPSYPTSTVSVPTLTPFQPEINTETPQPTQTLYLNPPVDYPNNLDGFWYSIDSGKYGFTFDTPCENNIPAPVITWDMAKLASEMQTKDRVHPWIEMNSIDISNLVGGDFPTYGIVKVSENDVFGKLIQLVGSGSLQFCGDKNKKPIAYGPGVQEFLDWLQGYIQ